MTETTRPLKQLNGEDLQKYIDFEPLQVAHRLRKLMEIVGAKLDIDYFISPLPSGSGLEFFYMSEKGKLALDSIRNSIIVNEKGEIR